MKGKSQTTCSPDILALLEREGDGSLTPADEARLHSHLTVCVVCAREAERRSQVVRLLRRDPLPLSEVRLPTGEELARSVIEAAGGRHHWPAGAAPWARRAAGVAAGLAVVCLATRAPTPSPAPPASTAITSVSPRFWIEDDEQTGRNVLLDSRPARTGVR